MTKEMKRPISNITQDSIKPLLSNAVEFYTNKNREAHKCIQERDEYINYLESKLSNAKPQQALPVVPECVAEWIDHCKGMGYGLIASLTFKLSSTMHEELSAKILKWLGNGGNDETFALAFITGKYQVEKPQLFYLKHIDMSKADKECDWYLITDCVKLCHEWVGKNLKPKDDDFKFTQQEIDSMQTGSYELVPVEDGE